ncbi:MAG TPA: MBL fold metallo-hydrolase, partial [Spirochaetota bacterium]|nr:MBL fold metallo-hydrolase [Spirochaetota bacterium]
CLWGDHIEILPTPGHTRGSICLYLEDEGALFSGDHILGHITPNAFVMLDDTPGLPARMSQREYFESLRRIELLGPRVVHPAHGAPVIDLAVTLALYRRQFSARRERILSLIGNGYHTPYSIGRKLFPGIGGVRLPLELYLAVSEVFTHLQVLESDGRVSGEKRRGTMHYSA